MTILLASGSPRRRELLDSAQLSFSTLSVDIDETPLANELPTAYIKRMVKDKSVAAVEQLNLQASSHIEESHSFTTFEPIIILTADTIGVLADGKTVLVKPANRAHAYSMWQQMSDTTHQVWTAVQALKVQPSYDDKGITQWQVVAQRQIMESTEVSFVPLTSAMMAQYWESGEPADKAGGYAIQGLAAAWVTYINGSYTNVVGLPLAQTLALIDELQAS